MKKLKSGVFAIMLAIAAFAFTAFTTNNKKFVDPYWYHTQNNGTVIIPSSAPPQSAADPFGCTGTTYGCSKAFTSYNPVTFAPAGTLVAENKKNTP